MTAHSRPSPVIDNFTLFGGPAHRFGERIGLVREHGNSWRVGAVLAITLWLVVVILAAVDEGIDQLFSLRVVGGHVRLLIVIPLLYVGETWLGPRVKAFIRMLWDGFIIPEHQRARFEGIVKRTTYLTCSGWSDTIAVVATILITLAGGQLGMRGSTGGIDLETVGGLGLAAKWYSFVCLPLVRFLFLRWLWRLLLWCWFLWELVRLDLNLVPTHPDGAGGLGYLEVVHTHFMPLIVAMSAIQAAAFAEAYVAGKTAFEAIYTTFVMTLAIDALFFLGPLFILAPDLWKCRVKGLSDYMILAEEYVRGFRAKWLGAERPADEALLGSADIQSLADLNNSVGVIRDMRPVPISVPLLVNFTVAALGPMLPVFLLKYPAAELAQRFLLRISGQ